MLVILSRRREVQLTCFRFRHEYQESRRRPLRQRCGTAHTCPHCSSAPDLLSGIVIFMTLRPPLVNPASHWIASARSFHHRQLTKHRTVMRLGNSRVVLTKGQAMTSSAAVFAAGSMSSAGAPDWIFWTVLLGGIIGGRFVFPIPVSSIASRRGPSDVAQKSDVQLDGMIPEQIRTYENNMILKHRLKGPEGLGTAQALWRQIEAARAAEQLAAIPSGSLAELSLVDAQAFGGAALQHDRLKSRWLAYELDPQLQFDFPAMSDTSVPATAAMIRASQAAERVKPSARLNEYQSAVAAFGEALCEAEAAAGVPQK